MPVTTSSNEASVTSSVSLTYPAGADGDTLLVWLSISDSDAPTLSGDLDSSELLDTISSTGRLRVYKRTRQSGDSGFTATIGSTVNAMQAIAANVPADMDTSDPSTFFVGAGGASFPVDLVAGGPGLLAVWFSFSEITVSDASLLEDADPDGDVTLGFELRLYQMTPGVDAQVISQTTPTHPSFPLTVRAVSITASGLVVGRGRWGRVGWPAGGLAFASTWTGDTDAATLDAFSNPLTPAPAAGDLLVNFLHWWTHPLDFSEFRTDSGFGYVENGWTQEHFTLSLNFYNGGSDDRVHIGQVVSDGDDDLLFGWDPDDVRCTSLTVSARGSGHTLEGTYINERILETTYENDLATGGTHVLLFVVTKAATLTHNADQELEVADIGGGYPATYCLLYNTGDPSIDLACPDEISWVSAVAVVE